MGSVALVLFLVGAPGGAEDQALAHAKRLLSQVPLVDGHNDLPWEIRENAKSDPFQYDLGKRHQDGDTDIPRLREGQVGGQFWSVWIPSAEPGPARTQLEQIELARRMIAAYPDVFMFATRASDVDRAKREGKIASFLGMENGQALENSLGALRAYYDLGVRYMTLTHGRNTDWADSATDKPVHGGLTAFGCEVVREMNRLGMLVDLSHVSAPVMRRALEVAEAPVIFSHSGARAVVDHPRNVPDDVLSKVTANGGVVMVPFIPSFVSAKTAAWGKEIELLMQGAKTTGEMDRITRDYEKGHGPEPRATLAQVADQIDYVAKVAGHDHVGIGADFYGGKSMPQGLEDVTGYPALFAELIRRGWSDADLAKLASGNVVRVLSEAEEAAERLQKKRPPSLGTIGELDGKR
jgi:membrane dipeptidase